MPAMSRNARSPESRVMSGLKTPPSAVASTLIVVTIVMVTLYVGRSILMPVAIAVLLAFVLTPLVKFLRRIRLPTVVAVLLAVGLCFSLLVAAGLMVTKQVTVLADNIPRYEYSLREKIKSLRGATFQSAAMKQAAKTIKHLGNELSKEPEESTLGSSQSTASAENSKVTEKPIPVTIRQPPPTAIETYIDLISTLLEPVAMTGLVFLFLTFILLQRRDLRDRFIRLVGQNDLERTTTAMVEAGERLSRFFVLQSLLNAAYGVAIGTALWLIGVPNPILWAGLAFLMRYVPYVGSVLAAAFPLILAAAVDSTWTMFFWTMGLYIVGESLMGQVVEPMAFGTNTGLSPFAVIASAMLWTSLWGPAGLVLAVPLTLVLVTMSRHIEQLSFLNVMFGDEPALGQVERFYQRALADDPVEASELAESFVKENSLLKFYDDVALGGLRLAQIDAERGVLNERRISVIVDTIAQVADDLSFVDDATEQKAPSIISNASSDADQDTDAPALIPVMTEATLAPTWRQSAQPVICVSGRSPLDASAAQLMAHLLETHGIQSGQLSFADFSTTNLKTIDLTGVQVVVLSYVSIGKGTVHIRSLIKRIRRANPDVMIVAGIWNNIDDDGASKEQLDIGADHTTNSLRTGLELCVEAASNHCPSTSHGNDQKRKIAS